jgi:SAM-dependent methyltransferase
LTLYIYGYATTNGPAAVAGAQVSRDRRLCAADWTPDGSADLEQAKALVIEENIPIRPQATPRLDSSTRAGKEKGYIADASVFDLICDASVQAVDISDYEGAEIVVDLNGAIPAHLEGRFDFIYNGSCLDNIFDPATSLKNMTKLLKPGGRIVRVEHATHVYGAYLTYSPAWFYDYYTINGFVDCKVYLAFFRRLDDAWAIYNWDPHSSPAPPRQWANYWPEKRDFVILTVAERGDSSTCDGSPVQSQYRRGDEIQMYIDSAERFSRSERPKLRGRRSVDVAATGTPEEMARRAKRAKNAKASQRALRMRRAFGALGRFVAGQKPKPKDPAVVEPSYTFCGYFD